MTRRSRCGCWSTAATSSASPAPRRSNRIHRLLLELLPGGAQEVPVRRSRPRRCSPPCGRVTSSGKTRRRLAAELIAELAVIDKKIKTANRELHELVAATGSSLLDLHGIGPSGAARLLGDVGDIGRFADRGHFASWNGTAPIDASSGDQNRHRLSRAGNRRINRVLHIMAIVQLRTTPKAARYYRPQDSPPARPRWKRCAASNAGCPTSSTPRCAPTPNDRGETGPGGHPGATLQSSAADSHPDIDTSDQSLPGPANTKPRTASLAAS